MDSILITGESDRFAETVKNELAAEYAINECEFSSQTLRRNIRMQKPRVLICFKGDGGSNTVFSELRSDFPELGIILICQEFDFSAAKIAGPGLMVLNRPVKMSELKGAIFKTIVEAIPSESVKRILAVDDSSMVLRNIRDIMGDEYELAFATSGKRALEMMQKKRYDLVLLDYEMPSMDGREVLQNMKEDSSLKDIPVVFLTGVADKKKIVDVVVGYRPEGYLLKPIDAEVLRETVHKIIG